MLEPNTRLSEEQSAFLDLVRGLAAMTVMLGHTWAKVVPGSHFGSTYPWQSFAVVVFFWLSGFLITYQALTKDRYSFGEYFIDRFCRIYVLYLPALVFTFVAYAYVLKRPAPPASEFLANAAMLQHTPFTRVVDWSWVRDFRPYFGVSPFWTIAVEWWLYMTFGVVYFAASKAGIGTRILMIAVAVPAILSVSFFTLQEYVAITWFVGSACAYAFVRTRTVNYGTMLVAAALCWWAMDHRFDWMDLARPVVNMYDIQYMVAMSGALFFTLMLVPRIPFGFLRRPFVSISAALAFISYALYLTHEPARHLLFGVLGWKRADVNSAIGASVGAIALALVFALLLENKHVVLRGHIKRWLGLRPAQPVAPPPPPPAEAIEAPPLRS